MGLGCEWEGWGILSDLDRIYGAPVYIPFYQK